MSDAERTLLVDASVFITLAGIDAVDLLTSLDGTLVVPEAVAKEVIDEPGASHLDRAIESGWLRVLDSPGQEPLEHAASHLGRPIDAQPEDVGDEELPGDVVLLAHALTTETPVVVTDDKPLRRTCKALSIPVSGSIGVLVRAVEQGDLDAGAARQALYAMDEVGARLSVSLVKQAERLIDEAAGRAENDG